MWNKVLAAHARAYPSAVLTIVDARRLPLSVRCIGAI